MKFSIFFVELSETYKGWIHSFLIFSPLLLILIVVPLQCQYKGEVVETAVSISYHTHFWLSTRVFELWLNVWQSVNSTGSQYSNIWSRLHSLFVKGKRVSGSNGCMGGGGNIGEGLSKDNCDPCPCLYTNSCTPPNFLQPSHPLYFLTLKLKQT